MTYNPTTASNPNPDFEVFEDRSYYDMWAVRPKGRKAWGDVVHFNKREEAITASHIFAQWIKDAKKNGGN